MNLVLIIPTLNSYTILPKLINSLKMQTFVDWKLIFVDGNSSKEHKKWLEEQCKMDRRLSFINQINTNLGIFGAMAEGIDKVNNSDWILFWGSDDWAFSNNIFEKIYNQINNYCKNNLKPDLIICNGKYVSDKGEVVRNSSFSLFKTFRLSLFIGSIPAHQATIFNSELLKNKISFKTEYKLAADLDIFLRMSKIKNLRIKTFNIDIVKIAPGGISKRLFNNRIYEVYNAYKSSFGILWIIPFLIRYIKKIISYMSIKFENILKKIFKTTLKH